VDFVKILAVQIENMKILSAFELAVRLLANGKHVKQK
jgi:hypothetical protein